MLRKSYSNTYVNQVKSTVGDIFLSNSARNKKYDGDKSGMSSFDFSEIQSAIKNKSYQQLMEHELFPIILVIAVLCFILFVYVIIAIFSSSFLLSHSTSDLSNSLNIEVEQVLSKLIELRKDGNMKEYEEFLQPSMRKYCLNDLGSSYFDTSALESFHMNLAETISFIARGVKIHNKKEKKSIIFF